MKPPKQGIFTGVEANAEIQAFMSKRWHRQVWQIEYKAINGLSDASPLWHIKGTDWWVRLDGPEYLKRKLNLSELDITQLYEFTGVAVDQNYGVITFYVLSAPKSVTVGKVNKES